MKRVGISLFLALLFVGVVGFTALSQQAKSDAVEVQILEGGISQELPIDITLLMSTTTGVQTVTVPLKLNINLTVGPIDAVDLSVEVQNAAQFVSPLRVVEPAEETEQDADAGADAAEDADDEEEAADEDADSEEGEEDDSKDSDG